MCFLIADRASNVWPVTVWVAHSFLYNLCVTWWLGVQFNSTSPLSWVLALLNQGKRIFVCSLSNKKKYLYVYKKQTRGDLNTHSSMTTPLSPLFNKRLISLNSLKYFYIPFNFSSILNTNYEPAINIVL